MRCTSTIEHRSNQDFLILGLGRLMVIDVKVSFCALPFVVSFGRYHKSLGIIASLALSWLWHLVL